MPFLSPGNFDLHSCPCRRSRIVFTCLAAVTVVLGLGSRHFAFLLPGWLAKNAGDILYATMIFWLAGLLFPAVSSGKACAGAFLVCLGIEFAKLVQAPWLVALRHTRAGALVLGSGFHASNVACYALGALLGWAIERGLRLCRAPSQP